MSLTIFITIIVVGWLILMIANNNDNDKWGGGA